MTHWYSGHAARSTSNPSSIREGRGSMSGQPESAKAVAERLDLAQAGYAGREVLAIPARRLQRVVLCLATLLRVRSADMGGNQQPGPPDRRYFSSSCHLATTNTAAAGGRSHSVGIPWMAESPLMRRAARCRTRGGSASHNHEWIQLARWRLGW